MITILQMLPSVDKVQCRACYHLLHALGVHPETYIAVTSFGAPCVLQAATNGSTPIGDLRSRRNASKPSQSFPAARVRICIMTYSAVAVHFNHTKVLEMCMFPKRGLPSCSSLFLHLLMLCAMSAAPRTIPQVASLHCMHCLPCRYNQCKTLDTHCPGLSAEVLCQTR